MKMSLLSKIFLQPFTAFTLTKSQSEADGKQIETL
jgi:hypothetical protein